jgi:hypothetical protein
MNTDYQDIKSYKKPNICENLCPNLTCCSLSDYLKIGRNDPRKIACGSLFKANAVKPIARGCRVTGIPAATVDLFNGIQNEGRS